MAKQQGKAGGTGGRTPVGVWNRGRGSGPSNPIRVRTKRLDEIDGDKIALAYWLLAKQLVDDRSDAGVRGLNEAEVRRVADRLDGRSSQHPARTSEADQTEEPGSHS